MDQQKIAAIQVWAMDKSKEFARLIDINGQTKLCVLHRINVLEGNECKETKEYVFIAGGDHSVLACMKTSLCEVIRELLENAVMEALKNDKMLEKEYRDGIAKACVFEHYIPGRRLYVSRRLSGRTYQPGRFDDVDKNAVDDTVTALRQFFDEAVKFAQDLKAPPAPPKKEAPPGCSMRARRCGW